MTLFLLPTRQQLHMDPTQLFLETFFEDVRPILQIIAKVLGREDTTFIDKDILGMFNLILQPKVVVDIPAY